MIFKIITLFSILVLFFYLSKSCLLNCPPIWPDEAYIADISRNFMTNGQISTKIWSEIMPSTAEHFLWYPPGIFYILAGVFKIFGFSLEVQRLASVSLAVMLLASFFLLVKTLVVSRDSFIIAGISTLMLSIDNFFLQASRISRPEIYVLFFGTLSLTLFNYLKIVKKKLFLYYIVGILAGLSALMHFEGLVFGVAIFLHILFLDGKNVLSKKRAAFFILGYLTVFSFYSFTIIKNFDIFKDQIMTQLRYRELNPTYLIIFYHSHSLSEILVTTFYLSITLFFIFYSKLDLRKHLSILIVLVFTWIFAILGKLEWYPVLAIPFVYIALTLIFTGLYFKAYRHPVKWILVFILFLLISANLKIYSEYRKQENFNYHEYGAKILENIPKDKTVYISAVPDPYFAFIQRGEGSLRYFLTAPSSTFRENFLKTLKESDFIVINRRLEGALVADILDKYLNLNTEKMTKVNYQDQEVEIIELKSKDKRAIPEI